MTKKEFSGGLNELFGENSLQQEQQPTTPPAVEEAEVIEEATPEEEEDLINSVEDEELREALRQKRMKGRGRPRKGVIKAKKASDGYERACMIVSSEKYGKIKAISLRETLQIKEVMEAAMDLAIEAYEKKNGKIILKQPPKKKASELFK